MESKFCTKCGECLPISEFGRCSTGYLRSWCKECMRGYAKKYYVEKRDEILTRHKIYKQKKKEKMKTLSYRHTYQRTKEFQRDVLGGYKIYLLNHIKKGERKYNIIKTNGETFKTNDKSEFMRYLEGI